MTKYCYVKTHFKYGVMVTPANYSPNPIWLIAKGKGFLNNDLKRIPITDKKIEKVIDNNLDNDELFMAETLEQLKSKLKKSGGERWMR